jgi:hypothetical protein
MLLTTLSECWFPLVWNLAHGVLVAAGSLSPLLLSVFQLCPKRLPMELSLAEFAGEGQLLMVVGRLLLFLKQGQVGVGGCSKFSFSFFETKREGRGGGGGGGIFVN